MSRIQTIHRLKFGTASAVVFWFICTHATVPSVKDNRDKSAAGLEEAMSCAKVVSPEGVLQSLQRDGVIASKPYNRIDGIPVFEVIRPFRIHDMEVKFVEGWDYKGKLFERAPGTAPGTFLAITVEGTKSEAERSFPTTSSVGQPFPDLYLYVEEEITAFNYRKVDRLAQVVCNFGP